MLKTEKISPVQIKMARVGANLTIRELAEITGLNKATIVRIEAGGAVKAASIKIVKAALEKHGAEFCTSESGQMSGVTFPTE